MRPFMSALQTGQSTIAAEHSPHVTRKYETDNKAKTGNQLVINVHIFLYIFIAKLGVVIARSNTIERVNLTLLKTMH